MPRMPTVESLGQRPTDLSRQPIVRQDLATSRAGEIKAQGLTQLGAGVNDLGNALARLNERDKILLDEAYTEDATSQYLGELTRFTHDPEVGYQNRRGREALADDVRKEYNERRYEAAKKIEEKLTSPAQVNAFRQRAVIANRQFDAGLTRHVAEQTNAYHEQVYEGVIQAERSRASSNWREPGQIETSILRSLHVIDVEATRKGMPAIAVQEMHRAAETQIHSDVVQTMLMEGNDTAALQYFEGVKGRLTPESRIALGLKVQASSVDGEAARAAQGVWQMAGPKGENDPVLIADMEAEIRRQYGGDPRVADSAIARLRSMAQAHNAQQQEVTATRKARLLDAYHQGADLETLQRLPEYIEMDGESKVELRDYILNRGWTENQRARSDAQWLEGEKAKAGFQEYWTISNPAALSSLSEAEILAKEPSLGRELVSNLMEQKRRQGASRGVLSASIDDDMFKVLADEAGLKPYDKNLSEDEKARLGRMKYTVESVINKAQTELGRELTREQKEELMRSEIDKKVIHERGFFSQEKMPVGAVGAADRPKISVPIGEVDTDWKSQAMNHMRSKGYAPLKFDDAEMQRRYRKRLENAYAVRISGGTAEEIDRALKGD